MWYITIDKDSISRFPLGTFSRAKNKINLLLICSRQVFRNKRIISKNLPFFKSKITKNILDEISIDLF